MHYHETLTQQMSPTKPSECWTLSNETWEIYQPSQIQSLHITIPLKEGPIRTKNH